MIKESTKAKYIGRKYGRLVVKSFSRKDPHNAHHYFYNCLCDCGTACEVRISNLQQQATRSCGCLQVGVPGNTFRRLAFGEGARNALYGAYKKGAQRRGINFSLSKEDFFSITSLPCFFCNKSPESVRKERFGYGYYKYNGVDRADNSVGYTKKNCLPCCHDCNSKKNSITKDMVFKLYEFFTQ